MVKKYDDNYIDLSKVNAVTNIILSWIDAGNDIEHFCFSVLIDGERINFSDTDKQRLSALRERLIKDWMEVRDARD